MEKPTIKDKKEILNLSKKEKIQIPETNKYLKIGYIKGYTQEKLSSLSIFFKENVNNDDNRTMKLKTRMVAKAVSYGVLNGMKIIFFHWAYWRWLYYIKGYNFSQLEPITKVIKKKVRQKDYSKSILRLLTIDVTTLSMTKEEIEAIQQEVSSESEDK
jgi:hypothetical protein